MIDGHRSRCTALAVALCLCASSSGCGLFSGNRTSTSNRPANLQVAQNGNGHSAKSVAPGEMTRTAFTPLLIQPKHELFWIVEGGEMPPNASMSGKAVVGPDGTIVLGPYGTFAVANMSVEQAKSAIAKKLTAYVQNPKVTLTIVGATAAGARAKQPGQVIASTWQPAQRSDATKPPASARSSAEPPDPASEADGVKTVAWRARRGMTVDPPAAGIEIAPMPQALPQTYAEAPAQVAARRPKLKQPVANVPRETSMVTLPPYVISPPDILQIDSLKGLKTQEVRGPHLVRPDGTVGLGVYGSVPVAGLTIDQAKEAIARAIHARLDPNVVKLDTVVENLSVDVLAYNSKVYYVITDRVGLGEVVERLPITGNETVLDAISQVKGLPPEVSKRHIWVARRCGETQQEQVLPVDWIAVTQKGNTETNYQVLPGDRIYVRADRLRQVDNFFGKVFAPIERLLGGTLLGSQTVNSIRSGAVFGVR